MQSDSRDERAWHPAGDAISAGKTRASLSLVPRILLIAATLIASWLGMQQVHEAGHVLGCALTGGRVERVVLHPLTISRTDLTANPHPLLVVWAGPLFGVAAPLFIWAIARVFAARISPLLRFFAGFCLIANGAYIAGGASAGIGDCGEMLRHGTPLVTLWVFGLLTIPLGLILWNGLGSHFGLGREPRPPDPILLPLALVAVALTVAVGLLS